MHGQTARPEKPLICKPARIKPGSQRPPEPALPPRGSPDVPPPPTAPPPLPPGYFSRELHGQSHWEMERFWTFCGYSPPPRVAWNFDPRAPTPVADGPAGFNMDFGLPDPVNLVYPLQEAPWKRQVVPTAKVTTHCKAKPSCKSKAETWLCLNW